MQILNVTENFQVTLVKTLTLLKHEDVIINTMTQTREKQDSLVLSRPDCQDAKLSG